MTGRLSREIWVWLALIAATALNWAFFEMEAGAGMSRSRLLCALLMAVAFIKAALVIDTFMEVRTAPLPLRLLFAAWVLIVGAALVIQVTFF